MAVDLPPMIPPQLTDTQRIEAYAPSGAEAVTATIDGRRLVVTGNRYLSTEELRNLLDSAKTPSQAIRAINRAYYRQGHLMVTVYYAPDGETVRVHVVNAKLADIEAPEKIRVHFTDLIGDENLEVSEFDRQRVLAHVKSEREGVDYKVTYHAREENPGAYTMVFSPKPIEDHDPVDLTLQIGNQGNRFLGRYFGGAGYTQQFDTGSELSLRYETALVDLGETSGGKDYDSGTLTFDHPSRFGLYGIEGSYTEYRREAVFLQPGTGPSTPEEQANATVCSGLASVGLPCESLGIDDGTGGDQLVIREIEAEIASVALSGEQVVYSDRDQRFTVSQRLETYTSEIGSPGQPLFLDEPHTALEVGAKYYRKMDMLGTSARVRLQSFVKGGVVGDDGTLGTDDRADAVSIGRRTSEFLLIRPKLGFSMDLGDIAAVSVDAVGQFSDDKQVPQQQQFVLGGISSLSAYLPAVLIGDSGSFVRISLEGTGWDLWGVGITPSLFVEQGRARFENVDGPDGDWRTISDGGVRLSADLGWDVRTEIVAAEPISEDNISKAALEAREADFFWVLKKTF